MSTQDWKSGDVGVYEWAGDGLTALRIPGGDHHSPKDHWHLSDGSWTPGDDLIRPLAVIDPEDREQVERLFRAWYECTYSSQSQALLDRIPRMQAALREYANPKPPQPEPTDPAAIVTDRRDNIWRLLADGDWVCTSGPDIGEYLSWARLADERSPLTVEID